MHDTLAAAGVLGVMFDNSELTTPVLADPGAGTAVTLPQGTQSPGNSIPQVSWTQPERNCGVLQFSHSIRSSTPHQWLGVQTGTIGLLEPGMGTQLLLGSQSFQDACQMTIARPLASTRPASYIDVAPGGAAYYDKRRALAGRGHCHGGQPDIANRFLCRVRRVRTARAPGCSRAYQAAFWDTVNNPEVVSSSWRDYAHFSPDSPFAFAYNELFIDAVLRNITMINAVGDGGSGDQFANGLTNVRCQPCQSLYDRCGRHFVRARLTCRDSGSDVDWHCQPRRRQKTQPRYGRSQPEA